MLNALVNRPNLVPERQRAYQQSTKLLWYRQPRSKLYVGTYYSLFSVAMLGTVYGVYALATGKKAEAA